MERHCRTTEHRIGNFILFESLSEDELILELMSLIDKNTYSALYRNGSMPEQLKQLFGSVSELFSEIDRCSISRNIGVTDLAQIILRLPNNYKEREVTLQLTAADHTSLSDRASKTLIHELLKEQCTFISRIDDLTLQLKKVEANKYLSLSTAVDNTTPFFTDFSLEGGLISHTKEDVWSSIYLRQELPVKGKFELNLQLVAFKSKSLMFGVGIGSLRKLQSSHSYQGSVMLCLSEGQTSIYERCGRNKATRGIVFEEGDRIAMKIDLDNLTLSWWLGDIQIAWTRVQKDHLDKQLSVRCEMLGTGDTVRFC